MIQLKQLGYTNIDGLDFAQRMLDLCKSNSLFNNYICASIEPGKKVSQVFDGKFLTTSSAFAERYRALILCANLTFFY